MRKIILSTAFVFAATAGALAASAPANAATGQAWCATSIEGNTSIDCSFRTQQQCQAFIAGRGGQCDTNVWNNNRGRAFDAFASFQASYPTESNYAQRP